MDSLENNDPLEPKEVNASEPKELLTTIFKTYAEFLPPEHVACFSFSCGILLRNIDILEQQRDILLRERKALKGASPNVIDLEY